VPPYPYDFVFIDGPTLQREPNAPVCFNADFVNVLMKADLDKKINGILDHRVLTYRVFKKLIPGARIRYVLTKKMVRISGATRSCLGDILEKM
jgi:hypothetical protein